MNRNGFICSQLHNARQTSQLGWHESLRQSRTIEDPKRNKGWQGTYQESNYTLIQPATPLRILKTRIKYSPCIVFQVFQHPFKNLIEIFKLVKIYLFSYPKYCTIFRNGLKLGDGWSIVLVQKSSRKIESQGHISPSQYLQFRKFVIIC